MSGRVIYALLAIGVLACLAWSMDRPAHVPQPELAVNGTHREDETLFFKNGITTGKIKWMLGPRNFMYEGVQYHCDPVELKSRSAPEWLSHDSDQEPCCYGTQRRVKP